MTSDTLSPTSVSIGHWTNRQSTSGCTVILFDKLTPAAVDVRGGAPGTRETALLGSDKTVRAVDARLVGGSLMFGIGWGLAGFCPGPAIVALGAGYAKAGAFVAAMLVGMAVVDRASDS